jgi:hypothetical protein
MTTLHALRSAVRDVLDRLADAARLVLPALGGHRPAPIPVPVRTRTVRR